MRREQGTRFTKIKRWNLENPDNPVIYTNQYRHAPIGVRFEKENGKKEIMAIPVRHDGNPIVNCDTKDFVLHSID
jgi:hypothetical protein